MKPIEFPLQSGDHGEKVTNLQDALLLLVDKKRIQLPPPALTHFVPDFVALVRSERGDQNYKDGTAQVVRFSREQFHLAPGVNVDEATASCLRAWRLRREKSRRNHESIIYNGRT